MLGAGGLSFRPDGEARNESVRKSGCRFSSVFKTHGAGYGLRATAPRRRPGPRKLGFRRPPPGGALRGGAAWPQPQFCAGQPLGRGSAAHGGAQAILGSAGGRAGRAPARLTRPTPRRAPRQGPRLLHRRLVPGSGHPRRAGGLARKIVFRPVKSRLKGPFPGFLVGLNFGFRLEDPSGAMRSRRFNL
jgi:hypothetical protein